MSFSQNGGAIFGGDKMEERLQEQVLLYEEIINQPGVGLARKLEIAEILRVLFYVRDGENISTMNKYEITAQANNFSSLI